MKSIIAMFLIVLAGLSTISCVNSSAQAASLTLVKAVEPDYSAIVPLAVDTPTPTATETPIPDPIAEPTIEPTMTAVIMPTETAVVVVAEQKVKNDFMGYFTTISLGKLSSGPRLEKWWESVIPAPSINEEEELCVLFTSEKEVENVFYGIFNIDSQTYAKPKTMFSRNGKIGRGNTSCFGRMPFSGKGEYEFEVWVGDILIASLPFEVKYDTATPVPQPTATRISQPAINPPPSYSPPPSSPLRVPATGFALSVSSMKEEAEVPAEIAGKVRGIYAFIVQPEQPNMIVSMRIYNLSGENITSVTIQQCLTNGEYTECHNSRTAVISAGNPVRQILLDANFSGNISEELQRRSGLNWRAIMKIPSITP